MTAGPTAAPAAGAQATGAREAVAFLALGDSYTIGEGVDAGDRWPLQLARALRGEGVALEDPRIIAATGWTTDELSAAIDAADPPRGFGLVSLLIGVNNQYRGRPVDEYRAQFDALLARAARFAGDRPGRVLVLSIPDWGVTPFAAASGRLSRANSMPTTPRRWPRAPPAASGMSISRRSAARAAASRGCWPPTACIPRRRCMRIGRVWRCPRRVGYCPRMTEQILRPLDAATAKGIARAFLPAHALGNRYDYYYTLIKLRTDPLYPGVLDALRGSQAPLLDLGCGLGLLAHALRVDGQSMPYVGVDIDAPKIGRARRIASQSAIADARFEVVDLARGYPPHAGSVAILDVLQFLTREQQASLLDAAIAMLAPGALLVMRAALDDGGARIRRTRAGDRFAAFTGWMPDRPRHYPTVDELRSRLDAAGLEVDIRPWFGNTPFNNWLVVARLPGA